MNKTQKIIIVVFCFILAGILIYGACVRGFYHLTTYGVWRKLDQFDRVTFFNDIRIYLAIVFIGAGVFFIAKKIKNI